MPYTARTGAARRSVLLATALLALGPAGSSLSAAPATAARGVSTVAVGEPLEFLVRSDGLVEVRGVGDARVVHLVRAQDVQALWARAVADGKEIVAVVEAEDPTDYARMIEVFDALKAAGAERISMRLPGLL